MLTCAPIFLCMPLHSIPSSASSRTSLFAVLTGSNTPKAHSAACKWHTDLPLLQQQPARAAAAACGGGANSRSSCAASPAVNCSAVLRSSSAKRPSSSSTLTASASNLQCQGSSSGVLCYDASIQEGRCTACTTSATAANPCTTAALVRCSAHVWSGAPGGRRSSCAGRSTTLSKSAAVLAAAREGTGSEL